MHVGFFFFNFDLILIYTGKLLPLLKVQLHCDQTMTLFREFPLWYIVEIPARQPHKYFCALFLRWHLMIRMNMLTNTHTHLGVSHTQQVWLRWLANHVFQVLANLQPLPSINRSIGRWENKVIHWIANECETETDCHNM